MILESLAVATIVTTITKSVLFAPLRNSKLPAIAKQLLHCPYCLAHWVSLAILLPSTLAQGVHTVPVYLELIINTFALVVISSLFTFLLILYIRWLDEH